MDLTFEVSAGPKCSPLNCEYDFRAHLMDIKNVLSLSFYSAPHCFVFDKGPPMCPPFLHNSGDQDSAGFLMG